jgi:hypothetical protein
MRPKASEADFIALFEQYGPNETARKLDLPASNVFRRRRTLEVKHNRKINGPESKHDIYEAHSDRLDIAIHNGVVIVGSDLHAWPGDPSTAFRAFIKFIKDLKPKCIILNGDVIDGASISRHPPIGWEKQPKLIEEIEAAQARLHEIELAATRQCSLIWPLGNHDARFSTRLATVAPEFAKIHGTAIKDHFGERWKPCWSAWINGEVVVKHRFKGGIHATHNNVLWGGKSMVTGHLHSLKVTPLSDYGGTKFGVDCGCLADTYGPQFRYAEDNPRNWRSGFAVLTFKDSQLLWPELVAVRGPGEVEFRGEILKV